MKAVAQVLGFVLFLAAIILLIVAGTKYRMKWEYNHVYRVYVERTVREMVKEEYLKETAVTNEKQ